MSLWTIREVIEMTGTTENALRYYSAKGVLPPTVQEPDGRRHWLYDDEAVGKLKKLFLLKTIGVSIEDAGRALTEEGCFREIVMNTLEDLEKQRDSLDRKIFIARTLAVSFGADLFAGESPGTEELNGEVLDEVIRELIRENGKEQFRSGLAKATEGDSREAKEDEK
ncbi:MAG: MerR family transcriptional regulator [Firmicutes bacterium]|nr:MerR family transcriptional regulator [Bacillota bacterium]